jgi:choline dehydrogenase-like flavoprotein
MPFDFDLVVIGSGAGGGTFAHACSKAGKNVLLIERGRSQVRGSRPHDERATLIDKQPYDDRLIYVNGVAHRLYMGGVLGGGTSLYGAALLRPSPDDFCPGRSYGTRIPRAIWDWPVSYDDMEPYYDQAERLFGVAGAADENFSPLSRPRHGYLGRPLPLQPINRRLMSANTACGLRPFRLPLAIDGTRCLRCDACAGYLCPTGARQSSAHLLENNDSRLLTVMTETEAECLTRDSRANVDGVQVVERATGKRKTFRARRYALAAGAIGSPALLLRSGVDEPLVGRNYMYHLSPIVVGILPKHTRADVSFIKQIGFADYYFGSKDFKHKLGLVQSLPAPGPSMMAKVGGRTLPRGLVALLRRRMLPLAGIVEDLPDPNNRVLLGYDGAVQVEHTYAPYDEERGRHMSRLMARILNRAGALFCLSRPFPSEEHVAHQCGTLRFGKRPEDAVVSPDGRLFSQPNVFVVDGSVFPTSLGVGPALTIMAHALRIAEVAIREL